MYKILILLSFFTSSVLAAPDRITIKNEAIGETKMFLKSLNRTRYFLEATDTKSISFNEPDKIEYFVVSLRENKDHGHSRTLAEFYLKSSNGSKIVSCDYEVVFSHRKDYTVKSNVVSKLCSPSFNSPSAPTKPTFTPIYESIPKKNITTSLPVVFATPKPVVTTPKTEVTTPKPVVTTPKPVVSTTPKPATTTPKPVVSTTPKPMVSTTPKNISTIAKPTVSTTPKTEVTTPKTEVTTPKTEVTTPKNISTTAKPVVPTTTKTVTTTPKPKSSSERKHALKGLLTACMRFKKIVNKKRV